MAQNQWGETQGPPSDLQVALGSVRQQQLSPLDLSQDPGDLPKPQPSFQKVEWQFEPLGTGMN